MAGSALSPLRRRWPRVVGGALVLSALAVLLLMFDIWSALGSKPSGERLARLAQSPQYRDGRFVNTLPTVHSGMSVSAARDFFLGGSDYREPTQPLPIVTRTAADFAETVPDLRVTWLGHSTLLVELDGTRVLVDPVWGERASPMSFAGPERFYAPPLPLAELPALDAVVISHDHYDHLDLAAIAFLHERDRPLVLVPLGVGQRLGAARTVEMDWWQVVETHGLRIHSAPAKHFSGRSLGDRDRTLWASWYLEPLDDDAPTVYYAGDSGYASHFADVRERFGAPDLAIVPVGAYEPRWFMARVHVSPDEALQAYEDLGGPGHGTHFVPVHWGTFDLADDPLDAPRRLVPQRAAERGLDPDRIHVLDVGGQVTVE